MLHETRKNLFPAMASQPHSDDIAILVDNSSVPSQMCSNCKSRRIGSRLLCGFSDWCVLCDESLWSTLDVAAPPVAQLHENPELMQNVIHRSCDSKCHKSSRCHNLDGVAVQASVTPSASRPKRTSSASSTPPVHAPTNNRKRKALALCPNQECILDHDEPVLNFTQPLCALLPPVLNVCELGMSVAVMVRTLRRFSTDLPPHMDYNEFMWRYRRMCVSVRTFQVSWYCVTGKLIVLLIGFIRTT